MGATQRTGAAQTRRRRQLECAPDEDGVDRPAELCPQILPASRDPAGPHRRRAGLRRADPLRARARRPLRALPDDGAAGDQQPGRRGQALPDRGQGDLRRPAQGGDAAPAHLVHRGHDRPRPAARRTGPGAPHRRGQRAGRASAGAQPRRRGSRHGAAAHRRSGADGRSSARTSRSRWLPASRT